MPGSMIATTPQFGANKVSTAPIIDTRSFFGSSDFVLMGVAATLAFVLFYSMGERKARPYIRKRRRAARRKAMHYHRSELARLTRGRGKYMRKHRSRIGGGSSPLSGQTPIKFGKGAAVPFSSLPRSLQKQIARQA